jgi:hypothetical protein
MDIRFTGAARAQLLEEVEAMARHDPEAAGRLVDGVESVLVGIASGDEPGQELALSEAVAGTAAGLEHRLYYRVYRDTLWVLAIWSAGEAPGGEPQ